MGREARRVPLNFIWPLKKVWSGYLLPDDLRETQCDSCAGCGMTPARAWLTACAYAITMLEDDLADQQRGRPMHPYFNDFPSVAYGTRPSADIAELVTGLCDGEVPFMGRSTTDAWRATRKIIAAAGLDDETWGWCPDCAGHGSVEVYPGQRADAEAWQPTDPPTGDGWQMWETTSEGSPVSPVCATAEELAEWLADTGASMFGNATATRAEWLAIITGETFAHVEIAPGVVVM